MNVHDFQNPVYGDAADDSAQQDELYTTPQAPQAMSLGIVEDGPEYDYATNPGQGATTPQAPQAVSLGMVEDGPEYDYATNPGQGAVAVQVKTNGATHAAHEIDQMQPYEQLHHGIDPPDFVRLAEIEGAGYGSLN